MKAKDMNVKIKELIKDDELQDIYQLVLQRNPELDRDVFSELLANMLPMGYRCIAAYDENNQMVGVSGFWIMSQFYCRKSLRIDNFIVDENNRGMGIGKAMLEWVEKKARDEDCTRVVLDSLTGNVQSHGFYFREGFHIYGFHFTKEIL